MTTNALIGHTGFVGGVLRQQHDFLAHFNSSNIADIADKEFEIIVCAAAPGSMFAANKEPRRDLEKINELIQSLKHARAKQFVLISSIAVLQDFAGGDDESTTDFQEELPYGRHRRALEAFVEDWFDDSLIVRLPALFGKGLRKNFIFDLLNPVPTMMSEAKLESLSLKLHGGLFNHLRELFSFDPVTGMMKLDRSALDSDPKRADLEKMAIHEGFSATEFHNPKTTYQYYNMDRLWSDIGIARQAGLSHIHLTSEPLKAAAIHKRLTGRDMAMNEARLHNEDMRTKYASLWQRQGPYLQDADTVLDELAVFYDNQRWRAS